MSCAVTKCSTPECTVKMKACDLKHGKCRSCWDKQVKQNANVSNNTFIIQQPINQ